MISYIFSFVMCCSLAEADIQPALRIAARNDAIDNGERDAEPLIATFAISFCSH